MRSLINNSLICILFIGICTACNYQHKVYHSYQSLPAKGWSKSDTLLYDIPVTDSVPTTWHIYAEIRNKSYYPYQNLYLFVSNNLLDSATWKNDTIELALTYSNGKWRGAGWTSLFQTEAFIGSVVTSHPGKYSVRIAHGMKDEVLMGLNDIGIRIEK